ncbi:hypothetical protein TM7_0510 [candidate division TM7 genomosp. GTL1]|nr:hypothetical protein TM7_0510 [candidate division TM7 genomosp. GTL1]
MIKAVIFDCWGTLFTNSQSPHPFEKFANKIGHTISDRNFVKSFEHHLMLDTHDDLRDPIQTLLNDLKVSYDEQLVDELKDILIGSVASQNCVSGYNGKSGGIEE